MVEQIDRCQGITRRGKQCRYPANECPWHGERCGEPTKTGEPCQAPRASCTHHQPRCGEPTRNGPCKFLPHVCPDHSNAPHRQAATCAYCDGTFTSRKIKGRYCSPLCAWKAKQVATGVEIIEGSKGQIMGGVNRGFVIIR